MLANRMRTLLAVAIACVVLLVLWFATRDSNETHSQMQRSAKAPTRAGEAPSIATGSSAAPITGRVLIVKVHADKPLAAAEVRVDETNLLTDDDGIARMASPGSGSYSVSVHAPGFAMDTRLVNVDDGAADTIVDFAMVPGATLAGVVVDEANKRVAGAKVQVTRLGEHDDEPSYVVADANGAWEIEVAAGRYHLNARADGFGPTVAQPLELDGKPRRGVVVRVTSGGTLFGKVVDMDGKPVDGVTISAAQAARIDNWTAKSDAQGRYEMRGMPEGVYSVYRYTGRVGHQAGDAVIVHGERTPHDLVVDDDRIEGVVVDTKDKPLAGITIVGDDDEVTTDARGRFAIVLAKESGRAHRLFARRDKLALKPQQIDVEGSAQDVKIVLADEAILTGRATLDGKPVTDYAIDLAPAKDEDLLFMYGGQTLRSADGKFRLRDVAAGSWRVMIAAEGCDVALTEVQEVTPGKTIDVGVIALTRGRRISGHVRDAAGAPVAGARIILNDEIGPWDSALHRRFEAKAETVSDASGAFAFDGISRRTQSSTTKIIARHPVHGAVTRELTSDTAELAFEAMGGIDGVIENFAGDETFLSADRYSARVNRAGEFRFDGMPPGEYRITESMDSTHRRIKPLTVYVQAGRRTSVRVQLEMRTVTLRVRVASECKEVVRFSTDDANSSGVAGEVKCKPGTATLPFVPPGTYTACDWERRCATVVVTPSPLTQSIELRLVAPP